MKQPLPLLALAAACLLALAGCQEVEKFSARMHLTPEQAEKAKPVLSRYLDQQDRLLETLQQRPDANALESVNGGPGAFSASRPDPGAMKNKMKEHMEVQNEKFKENDNEAARELSAWLTPEHVDAFRAMAEAYRKEKIKSLMESHAGPGGQGGGPGRGGPGGGRGGPVSGREGSF